MHLVAEAVIRICVRVAAQPQIDCPRMRCEVILKRGGIRLVAYPIQIRSALGIVVVAVILRADTLPAPRCDGPRNVRTWWKFPSENWPGRGHSACIIARTLTCHRLRASLSRYSRLRLRDCAPGRKSPRLTHHVCLDFPAIRDRPGPARDPQLACCVSCARLKEPRRADWQI